MIADQAPRTESSRIWFTISVAAAILGLVLMVDIAVRASTTYDEVTYLHVGAQWWQIGKQDEITQRGSPLLFWKIQQIPVLWAIDRAGMSYVLDDPEKYQQFLIPLLRIGALPVWLIALVFTAFWAKEAYGPRAMAMASTLFALSPNLLAHGSLITMEIPLVACSAAIFYFFWRFLRDGNRRDFVITAMVTGLAWSCKFTTCLFPPILALCWWVSRWNGGERQVGRFVRRLAVGGLGFLAIMAVTNIVLTGFRFVPFSTRIPGQTGPVAGGWFGSMLVPVELVGFVNQLRLQRHGGSSYLFGEIREKGWSYYYLVCLAVKIPPSFWLLIVGRIALGFRRGKSDPGSYLCLAVLAFLAITAIGSTRNYGIRYLLPMAPLTIVWLSAIAEAKLPFQIVAMLGLLGQAGAVAAIHPHELSYFPRLMGGPAGGRRILADSNLDWGQGLKSLAQLQQDRPEFRDLTLYYFGDTEPAYFGIVGTSRLINAVPTPPGYRRKLVATTRYLAVSSSLQFGPWGPKGLFRPLDGKKPVVLLDDATIAIYNASDINAGQ